MKIIDEKGRVFGRMNIIDMIVVIILVVFSAMFYNGYKIMTRHVVNNYQWAKVKVNFYAVSPEIFNIMKEGDVALDSAGKPTARLEKINEVGPCKTIMIDDKKAIGVIHPFNKGVMVTLDLLCVKIGRTLFYNDMPVKLGNTIMFSTDRYNQLGIVADF